MELTYKRILLFFVPLGLSASLTTLSHVIINSTLSRSAHPEITIAGYSIAMSLFVITERPANLLRQTCSALAADRIAFRAVAKIAFLLLLFTLLFSVALSYTAPGKHLIGLLFNVDGSLMGSVLDAYRILVFVTIFSAIRCLYHGIIIRNMQTKWLTIGIFIRLTGMYLLSLYFIHFHPEISGSVGAIIFLSGMLIEAVVSYLQGRKIYREMPEQTADSSIRKLRDVFPFYRPLLFSAFLAVIIGPAINVMLGKTVQIELAIASYALALSVANLVNSFYTYVHQIVLNFHAVNAAKVKKFAITANVIPAMLIAIIAFSPVGNWLVGSVIGASGDLLSESLSVLRVFVILSLVFPWVDYCNGLVMLRRKTRVMVWSQTGNVSTTIVILVIATLIAPSWNGLIGALAQSFGVVMELIILLIFIRRLNKACDNNVVNIQ